MTKLHFVTLPLVQIKKLKMRDYALNLRIIATF